MNIGILGTKLGMTQIFDESGLAIPVTIIKAGPCLITQIKTLETDGYSAIQVGYSEIQSKLLTKPRLGHLEKAGNPPLKYLKEYRVHSSAGEVLGATISVNSFTLGDKVSVTGKTIGKGFAGTKAITAVCASVGGTKHFIVEQESYQGQTPLAAVKQDLAILKSWGY